MAKRKPRRYHIGDAEGTITVSGLRRAKPDIQKEVMRDWFHEHFQDPVECCPYESAEGGYQFFRGGPFEPHDVLSEEFDGVVRTSVIEELAEELANQGAEWEGRDRDDGSMELRLEDYGNYFFDSLATSLGPLGEFDRSIADIRKALAASNDDAEAQFLHRLLYTNVITALEAYLADFFSRAVTDHATIRRKFVETNGDFQKEKVCISEIFKTWEGLEEKLKEYLAEIAWHNLARIKPMFKSALGIDFPEKLDELFRGILVRHDLVHRNGKKKDGSDHTITRARIEDLIKVADSLVRKIEEQWKALMAKGAEL